MSHKQFTNEVKELNSSIIMDKCNSKFDSDIHVKESYICCANGFIIDSFFSIKSEKSILSILKEKGYEKCIRRDSYAYCSMFNEFDVAKDMFIEWKYIWIKKII